jgi:hypothetical protein
MTMNMREWTTLPQVRKDAWWLWTGLQSEIQHLCAMLLEPDVFECPSLPPLEPGDTLSFIQPRYEQMVFAYGAAERTYMMNVEFDPDMLSIRFAIDNEPYSHELLIVRRRKQSLLMDGPGFLLTGDQGAAHILRSLLVGWRPTIYDTVPAA